MGRNGPQEFTRSAWPRKWLGVNKGGTIGERISTKIGEDHEKESDTKEKTLGYTAFLPYASCSCMERFYPIHERAACRRNLFLS